MSDASFDIHYVARLARLELTPAEEERLGAQLGQVLEYMEQLRGVDVTGVEPTAHAQPRVNVTRSDVVKGSLAAGEAWRNAPAAANGLFQVPKIVE